MPERTTPSFIDIPARAENHGGGDELAEMDTLPSEPDPVPAGDPPQGWDWELWTMDLLPDR